MELHDNSDFSDLFDERPERGVLSYREKIYINEYIATQNKALSAERAGLANPPTRPLVLYEINRLQNYYLKSLEKQSRSVIEEYAKVAFFDIRNVFDEDGNLKNIKDLDDHTAAAIAAIDVQSLGQNKEFATVTKYKFADKMKGLESLAKMLNLFEADNKRHVQLDGELGIRETTENDKKRRLAFVLSEAKRGAMKNSETGT